MDTIPIHYRFRLADGSQREFQVTLDADTVDIVDEPPADPPPWAALTFHQCPHCPLSPDTDPQCPLALRLVDIVEGLGHVVSHDTVHVEVVTPERRVSQETSAQRASSSLMGLVMASSGCPRLAPFRPMARFHLPLASQAETTYRATSMYMLAQYFVIREGRPPDLDMEGLAAIYNDVSVVNTCIADRLREAATSDSHLNAVVLLDTYAQTLPMLIEDSLDNLRPLFAPYVDR